MSSRRAQQTPASILPDDEIRQILIDHLLMSMASLWGRLSTLEGEQRELPTPASDDAVRNLEETFDEVLAPDRPGVPDGAEDRLTIGIVGTGPGGGHPTVVQVIRHAEHVAVVAHALTGPGMQGSPAQALDVVGQAWSGRSSW